MSPPVLFPRFSRIGIRTFSVCGSIAFLSSFSVDSRLCSFLLTMLLYVCSLLLCHASSSAFPYSFLCLHSTMQCTPVPSRVSFVIPVPFLVLSHAFLHYIQSLVLHKFSHAFPCAFAHAFPCAFAHANPCAFPHGFLLRFPMGSLVHFPMGSLVRLPMRTLVRFPMGSFVRSPMGSLVRFAMGSLVCFPMGSLAHFPIVSLVRFSIVSLVCFFMASFERFPDGFPKRFPFVPLCLTSSISLSIPRVSPYHSIIPFLMLLQCIPLYFQFHVFPASAMAAAFDARFLVGSSVFPVNSTILYSGTSPMFPLLSPMCLPGESFFYFLYSDMCSLVHYGVLQICKIRSCPS